MQLHLLRDFESPQIKRSIFGSPLMLSDFDVLVFQWVGIRMKTHTGIDAWGLLNKMEITFACSHKSWLFALDVSSFIVNGPAQTTVTGDPARFQPIVSQVQHPRLIEERQMIPGRAGPNDVITVITGLIVGRKTKECGVVRPFGDNGVVVEMEGPLAVDALVPTVATVMGDLTVPRSGGLEKNIAVYKCLAIA